MVSTPRSGTAREPTQHRSKLKIELPTFSGDPLQRNEFWKLISRLIDKETDITDEEKTYFLIQSMRDSESETCARSAATYSDSYSSVVEALQKNLIDHGRTIFSTSSLSSLLVRVNTLAIPWKSW